MLQPPLPRAAGRGPARTPRLAAVLVACLAVAAAPAWGDGEGHWWWEQGVVELGPAAASLEAVPPDEVLEAEGAIIGEVVLQRLGVFDASRPEEDRFLFRAANSLHVTTREKVLERRLLFRPGDRYSRRTLQETERLLRGLDYLFDAWVGPLRYRNGVVDVLVVTRDVWTLGVSAGFNRSGGANTTQFEVLDSNFIGTGRMLTAKYAEEPDRETFRFRYLDPQLFGTRSELRLLVSDNSDGYRRTVDLERPFYSLDARWAAGARLVGDERVSRLYADGSLVRVFEQEVTGVDVRGGFSRGYRGRAARRFTFGFTYEEHRFSRHDTDPGPPRNFPRSIDRTVSYPWVGVEYVQDRFVELRNLDQLGRTEDLNLGTEVSLEVGYSAEAFGADEDQAVLLAHLGTGASRRPGELVLFAADLSGRYGATGAEDAVLEARLELYKRNFGRHQLYVLAEGAAAWDLDPESQFVLGGDNGLRGYSRYVQSGDRRFLFTIEQRFYTDLHLLQLAYVGGAAFFDVGRAWYTEGPWQAYNSDTLKNVGVGLRLSSSRSSRGTMIHFDVAYPLDGDEDGVQWLVTTKESF